MRAWSSNERWMATSSILLKMGKELVVVYIRQHSPIYIENSAQTPGKPQSEEFMFHSDTSQI
jgi:hypothetical protein